MKRITTKTFGIFFAALIGIGFVSCVSVQKDMMVEIGSGEESEKWLEIEKDLVALDGKYYGSKSAVTGSDETTLKKLITETDKLLSDPLIGKSYEAKLLAIKGRLLLLSGNKTESKKCFSSAKKKFENEEQVLILGRRLGEPTTISSSLYNKSPVLMVEAALENFDGGKYDVACGLFDEAFLNSNGYYREPYSALREKSWTLRNVDLTTGNADFWSLKSITLLQMMEITQDNSAVLDYYTGGKKIASKSLFAYLKKAGLLESQSKGDSSTQKSTISEATPATRILSARFLWNIYANRKDIDPKKYSSRYRSRANARSPVSDIEITNEDFDAVLGCIENEIMTLVDGKNFAPEEKASATDFGTWVKNVAR